MKLSKKRCYELLNKAFGQAERDEASLFVFACGKVMCIKDVERVMFYTCVSHYVALAEQGVAPLVMVSNTTYFDYVTYKDFMKTAKELEADMKNLK